MADPKFSFHLMVLTIHYAKDMSEIISEKRERVRGALNNFMVGVCNLRHIPQHISTDSYQQGHFFLSLSFIHFISLSTCERKSQSAKNI